MRDAITFKMIIDRKNMRLVNLLLVMLVVLVGGLGSLPGPTAAAASPRTVNVWPTSGSINWATAPIYWFGKATTNPNYNYVDVRVAYDAQSLYIYATIVDYYLWYDPNGTTDPRTYDALGVYLDTRGDSASAPQTSDYFFVSGYRFWPSGNDARWHRQGRGTGSGWDENWTPSPAWTDATGNRFYNSGPNNNSDLDGGWTTSLTIPWATLGLAGPPSSGTSMGLGTILYDRDDALPAPLLVSEIWPETMNQFVPSSWGRIAFSPPAYQAPPSVNPRTITIRRGLNTTSVQDSYVGGGGNCGGGIFGGGDTAHPTDSLFVQNEADVSDFPCFSKSFLQFDLSAIPAGKIIQSAQLVIYAFGGSNPSVAPSSFIQPFAVRDAWNENTLTWNNQPLAAENFPGTWVPVITTFPGWPGVPSAWDVTAIVANAHAMQQPANLALYSADTGYNTGKYFVSSDAGDWDAAGRPTLIIVYGDATGGASPTATPLATSGTPLPARAFLPAVSR